MYRPSCENRTSEIEEMISEKKDRDEGSSSCSNTTSSQYACNYTSFYNSGAQTFRVLVA
jgi:hypothetical protein